MNKLFRKIINNRKVRKIIKLFYYKLIKGATTITGTKMRFSAHCCFQYDNSAEERDCLNAIIKHLKTKKGLALYGEGQFLDYLLKNGICNECNILCIIANEGELKKTVNNISVVSLENIPPVVNTIFICETLTVPTMYIKQRICVQYPNIEILTPNILTSIYNGVIPDRAFIPFVDSIYPRNIPDITFLENQDLILLDCPSRNLDMMPNGLVYVHNTLKKTNIKFQTLDLDNIIYHRYHMHRLFDTPNCVCLHDGFDAVNDPWATEFQSNWSNEEFLKYFNSEIDEIVQKLTKAKPQILAFSIQQNSALFSRKITQKIKMALPNTLILIGGYSCYYPAVGSYEFSEFDYMISGEAELIIGSLVESLMRGEKPKDIDGVVSKFDSPGRVFQAGKQMQNLDDLDMPTYDWVEDLTLYQNYNGYQLTPITGSRGCRWGRCRFCGERFFWRSHSPKRVVDEIEWLYEQGCDLFHFNESDFNGKPENVLAICDEIINRKLKIKLTGQLRIDKHGTYEFFDKLKIAGFVSIRFGVDAWTDHTLRLQNKGYTEAMISENLKNAHNAGIFIEVNSVIGVPGETEEDVDKSIEFIIQNKKYIDSVANFNSLHLQHGSEYWNDPEKYGICFRSDKKELYKNHPTHITEEFWYSVNPYIDGEVRSQRFIKTATALYENGLNVGKYAEQIIKTHKGKKGINNHSNNALKKISKYKIVKHGENFYKIKKQYGFINKNRTIDDQQDYKQFMQLITEGFQGYNIIKIKQNYYAIKQGYSFDKHRADGDQYETGVCFRGKNVREVESLIDGFFK